MNQSKGLKLIVSYLGIDGIESKRIDSWIHWIRRRRRRGLNRCEEAREKKRLRLRLRRLIWRRKRSGDFVVKSRRRALGEKSCRCSSGFVGYESPHCNAYSFLGINLTTPNLNLNTRTNSKRREREKPLTGLIIAQTIVLSELCQKNYYSLKFFFNWLFKKKNIY